MKILLVGSNPDVSSSLEFERVVNAFEESLTPLKRLTAEARYRTVLPVNKLKKTLSDERPDVLHIVAHGSPDELHFRNEIGDERKLKADLLFTSIKAHPPRLIFLHGCNAAPLAAELWSRLAIVAIGFPTEIPNENARTAVVAFYEGIFAGDTVCTAFRHAKQILGAETEGAKDVRLFPEDKTEGAKAAEIRLFTPLEITAQFFGPRDKNGCETVALGLRGCPIDLVGALFSTDADGQLEPDPKGGAPSAPCLYVRGPARGGALGNAIWPGVDRDFRIYATFMHGGVTFATSSTLCEALLRNDQFLSDAGNANHRKRVKNLLRVS